MHILNLRFKLLRRRYIRLIIKLKEQNVPNSENDNRITEEEIEAFEHCSTLAKRAQSWVESPLRDEATNDE